MKNSISSNPIHTRHSFRLTPDLCRLHRIVQCFFFTLSLIQIRDDGDLADVHERDTRRVKNEAEKKIGRLPSEAIAALRLD